MTISMDAIESVTKCRDGFKKVVRLQPKDTFKVVPVHVVKEDSFKVVRVHVVKEDSFKVVQEALDHFTIISKS